LVFEEGVLRKIFGLEREKVRRELRRLRNEELCSLYSSLNIFRVIKSRRMRLSGRVARMGRGQAHTGFWCGSLRERGRLEHLGLDVAIILNGC